MATNDNIITVVGNLTDEPQLRFTGGGNGVTNLRVASSRRYTDREGQQQEETLFITVNAWRDLGVNIAESLHKGDRVVVVGRLRIRDYQDKDGQTRWITEIEADEVAPSLRWAKAKVEKVQRGQQQQRGDGSAPPPTTVDLADAPDLDDVPF